MLSSYQRSSFSGRTAPRTLTQRAASYQATGDARVGGIDQTLWEGMGNFSGQITGGRTIIGPGGAILHPTTITQVAVSLREVTGATWKVKLFRHNGSTWDLVAEESFTPVVAEDVVIDLVTPWEAETGDVLGVWLPEGDQNRMNIKDFTALGCLFDTGDLTGDGVTFGSNSSSEPAVAAYGTRPYAASTSDSILGGTSDWWTPLDNNTPSGTIPGGDPDYNWCSYLPDGVSGANMGRGSTDFAWAVSTGWAAVAALDPHTVVAHFGVNDVSGDRTWEQVEANLDSLKLLWDGSDVRRLAIVEILPWTTGEDVDAATIRTWNANLATWCSANGALLIEAHDALGQVRAETGELDDLNSIYDDGDGVHLNAAGLEALTAIIEAVL